MLREVSRNLRILKSLWFVVRLGSRNLRILESILKKPHLKNMKQHVNTNKILEKIGLGGLPYIYIYKNLPFEVGLRFTRRM